MHDPQKPHFLALKRILQMATLLPEDRLWAIVYFLATIYSRGPLNSTDAFLILVQRQNIVVLSMLIVVYLSSNPVQHQRTKHIEINIHFVWDLVAAGQVHILYVPSHYQYADIFTKGLPSALFEGFRTSFSVQCPPDQTAGKC
ncbi:ribonuclease H-like domain-containing protein [Tanacetum coccineum]